MPIKGILFDFGGVLVRTATWEPRRRWERKLNLQTGELDALLFDSLVAEQATMGLRPAEDTWQYVAHTLNLSSSDLEKLIIDFWSADELDQELLGWIREIRPAVKVGILSNALDNARQIFTDKYELDGDVDVMVISAEVHLVKPDIRIYLLAAKELELQPDEIVFVDDMERNVAGARLAGMTAIRFTSSREIIATLRGMLKP